MSLFRPSSLSRTASALRSSSAIVAIRSFAALNPASSRSIATSRSASEHPTLPPALGYRARVSLDGAPAFFASGRRGCLALCTRLIFRLLSHFLHFLLYLLLGFLSFLF